MNLSKLFLADNLPKMIMTVSGLMVAAFILYLFWPNLRKFWAKNITPKTAKQKKEMEASTEKKMTKKTLVAGLSLFLILVMIVYVMKGYTFYIISALIVAFVSWIVKDDDILKNKDDDEKDRETRKPTEKDIRIKIISFGPQWLQNFWERLIKRHQKHGWLFTTCYYGVWYLYWTMLVWGVHVFKLIIWWTAMKTWPMAGEILAGLLSVPISVIWLIFAMGFLQTQCWYSPEKAIFYVEMLGDWPFRYFRAQGKPVFKNIFAKPWAIFSGRATLDGTKTTTTVYTKSKIDVEYNWAVAVKVTDPEAFLGSLFVRDFQYLKVPADKVETTAIGEIKFAEGINISEKLEKTMFVERAMAVIPGYLQEEIESLELNEIRSKDARKTVAEAVNARIKEELSRRTTEEGKEILEDPGVSVHFLPQNIIIPEEIIEVFKQLAVAKQQGKATITVMNTIADGLRKQELFTDEQIKDILMSSMFSESDGGALAAFGLFGGTGKRNSGHRKPRPKKPTPKKPNPPKTP